MTNITKTGDAEYIYIYYVISVLDVKGNRLKQVVRAIMFHYSMYMSCSFKTCPIGKRSVSFDTELEHKDRFKRATNDILARLEAIEYELNATSLTELKGLKGNIFC